MPEPVPFGPAVGSGEARGSANRARRLADRRRSLRPQLGRRLRRLAGGYLDHARAWIRAGEGEPEA
jgi:hypothetical protein